jgi:hypothetical protein
MMVAVSPNMSPFNIYAMLIWQGATAECKA